MVQQLTGRPPTGWYSESVVGFGVRCADRKGQEGSVRVEPGITKPTNFRDHKVFNFPINKAAH